MMQPSRPHLIVANWKMHKTYEESVTYVKQLIEGLKQTTNGVSLAVPFTVIKAVSDLCKSHAINVGAQTIHELEFGAFTGEISSKMAVSAGASFVLLGHSERRLLCHETDQMIANKVMRALTDNLQPLVCIGESLKERENDETERVIFKQLKEGLAKVQNRDASKLIIAYEPLWAIGTGRAAEPSIAQQTHAICRESLTTLFGNEIAKKIPILYGGSVNRDNASSFLEQPDVDGLLIGSASLDPENFLQIIHTSVSKPNNNLSR